MLWGAAPAPPESSVLWQPPRLGETRAPVRSNPGETWTEKSKHAQTVTALRIMARPNSHTFSQEQLEVSFQIVPPNTGSQHHYRKHYSFSVRFGIFFFLILLTWAKQSNFLTLVFREIWTLLVETFHCKFCLGLNISLESFSPSS